MTQKTRSRRWLFLSLLACIVLGFGTVGALCLSPTAPYAGPDLLPAAVEPATAAGPLRTGGANRRYFSDPHGAPVYLTGSHTWNSLQDIGLTDPPPAFDFDGYLTFLRTHQLNFIRLWRWEVTQWTGAPDRVIRHCGPHPWPRSGSQLASDGKLQFDLASFDDAFFDRLQQRVAAAADQGIYVSIMLFEGWVLRFAPDDWQTHPFHAANNRNGIDGDPNGDGSGLEIFIAPPPEILQLQRAYVRRVVDTVNAFDNVLYEISNENHPDAFSWQTEMVAYLRKYQAAKPKQHPIGLTSSGHGQRDRNLDTDRLFAAPADWISPNPDKHDYKANPPAADGARVVILDTDHLWGLGGDRSWVWKSFLRGLNPIFMDPYDGNVLAADDRETQWVSIRRALGHTAHFARKIELSDMVPAPTLTSTGYCLAKPGVEYLVYLPFEPHPLESRRVIRRARSAISNLRSHFARDVNVDLSAGTGQFTVQWFDPASGATVNGSATTAGTRVDFTAPSPATPSSTSDKRPLPTKSGGLINPPATRTLPAIHRTAGPTPFFLTTPPQHQARPGTHPIP